MMSKQREVLPRLVAQVSAQHPRCGILLWGSVNEGREGPTSDIDIFVVMPEEGENITLDQQSAMDGVALDIAYMPVHALCRELSRKPHWFFPFSQATPVHDPTGIAQEHQAIAREYFEKHLHVKHEWETQMDKVRRKKADNTYPLECPTWDSWARHMDDFVRKKSDEHGK